MAINSSYYDGDSQVQLCNAAGSKSISPAKSPLTVAPDSRAMSATSSAGGKRRKGKNNNKTAYVTSDRVQLLSHVTEEQYDKKFTSSFQLAANIYKSNSDEFKLKKKLRKKNNKKSVLTLPNEPSILPQVCTVSDMNDSEYCKRIAKPKAPKPKKRPMQKKRPLNKEYEFYDRDAGYCSQMDIYLDCSSTDVVKNFKGDCRKRSRDSYNSRNKSDDSDSVAPHDVWAVLRNINRFQFHRSPPMSDESSIVSPRKKKTAKKKPKRGVYETCRTEQIAYISSIELNVKSTREGSPSGSSIVTVIDNKDGFNKLCEEVHKTFGKNVPRIKSKNKGEKPMKAKRNNRNTINNNKALCYTTECKTNVEQTDETNKVRPSERKTNNDQTHVVQTEVKKNNDSKETLVERKSVITLKSEKTSNRNDSLEDLSCGGDICTEVEIQTDLENKESAIKSRINPGVYGTNGIGNFGALGDVNHQNPNIYGRRDGKVPFRRPLPSRVPWYNSNTQARPVLPPRPLMSGPTKIAPGPPKAPWTMSTLEECPRIPPHQPTTILNTEPMHQYTLSDIRRRVAQIKFPLVILGRDELRGSFKVEEYDHPQFNGLDEHVWPFMLDWTKEGRKSLEAQCGSYLDRYTNNQRPAHTINKQVIQPTQTEPLKYNKRGIIPKNNLEGKNAAKLKPIQQFRDKMLKLLYKKASDQNIVPNNLSCVQTEVITDEPAHFRTGGINVMIPNTVDVATSSVSIVPPKITRPSDRSLKPIKRQWKSPPPPTSPSKILLPPKPREKKRNWSKAKWASDIIENVIRKLKNGTYYTNNLQSPGAVPLSQESHQSNPGYIKDFNLPVHDSKEMSVQVTLPVITGDFTPKITIQKKKEPLITLPGFDDVLPPLEIKSMTRNQIAVKPMLTNILVQFDVNVPPTESDQTGVFKRSTSCIPLMVTESKTKIFKCKARILNAVLPAELCSIIPKVMKQFMDKDSHLFLEENRTSALTPCPKTLSLTPISESLAPEIHETLKLPLLPEIEIFVHPEVRRLRVGRFSKNPKSWSGKCNAKENIYIIALNELPYEYHSLAKQLLPRPVVNAQDYFEGQLYHSVSLDSLKCKSTIEPPIEKNLCTDLVPYSGNAMAYRECTYVHIVPQILTQFWRAIQKGVTDSISNYSLFSSIQLQTYTTQVSVYIRNHDGLGASICINMPNSKLGSLYQTATPKATGVSQNSIAHLDSSEKRIEYIKHAPKKEFKKTPRDNSLTTVMSKYKRVGHVRYVKLYKKCKSTSHIAAERSSTPLSKVTNIDEFFQALGASKLLSSAFDGSCGKKILSCISELKNWITGITPRQALLVMLLTNKKDTSNLVRFRPVILQGIAVNRITRVNELDMEIEVIERENFNKLPAYPGLTSILESTQNNDSLFEELCWIAKTTASDYQRRFDESSEKLLKSLLAKRKKLNPSYLRVMARYVGLGLLKTPANH